MRDAFVAELIAIARSDSRVMLLTGDLGFGVLTPFADAFPRQFVNVGVAEQNLTGLATGLALSGHVVFTYSIGNFPTLRCLEQIRNDVCYHDANVKVVAIGGGFSYGALGVSHHATEDLAIMRALPAMTDLLPGRQSRSDGRDEHRLPNPGCLLPQVGQVRRRGPQRGYGGDHSGKGEAIEERRRRHDHRRGWDSPRSDGGGCAVVPRWH